MSIILASEKNDGFFSNINSGREECFFCGRSLLEDIHYSTGGFVYWAGHGTDISMHQACAERLAVHLIQDARMLILETQIKSDMQHEPARKIEPPPF